MRTKRLWLESLEGRENPTQLSLSLELPVGTTAATVTVATDVTPYSSQPVDSTGNPLPPTDGGGTGTSGSGNGNGTATGNTGTGTNVPIVPIVPPVIRVG